MQKFLLVLGILNFSLHVGAFEKKQAPKWENKVELLDQLNFDEQSVTPAGLYRWSYIEDLNEIPKSFLPLLRGCNLQRAPHFFLAKAQFELPKRIEKTKLNGLLNLESIRKLGIGERHRLAVKDDLFDIDRKTGKAVVLVDLDQHSGTKVFSQIQYPDTWQDLISGVNGFIGTGALSLLGIPEDKQIAPEMRIVSVFNLTDFNLLDENEKENLSGLVKNQNHFMSVETLFDQSIVYFYQFGECGNTYTFISNKGNRSQVTIWTSLGMNKRYMGLEPLGISAKSIFLGEKELFRSESGLASGMPSYFYEVLTKIKKVLSSL